MKVSACIEKWLKPEVTSWTLWVHDGWFSRKVKVWARVPWSWKCWWLPFTPRNTRAGPKAERLEAKDLQRGKMGARRTTGRRVSVWASSWRPLDSETLSLMHCEVGGEVFSISAVSPVPEGRVPSGRAGLSYQTRSHPRPPGVSPTLCPCPSVPGWKGRQAMEGSRGRIWCQGGD